MNTLDAIYKWIVNTFYGWNTTGNVEVVDPVIKFTEEIEEKGYAYNDIKDWWERTWTTNNGTESIQEIYKKDEDGWTKMMIGYGDRVFYEEKVNET